MIIENLQLGAVPLSLDVLAKANIGLWAFELDEGSEPRMYLDDTMLGLVGLDHQVPPEEAYHAWYDHIDEGSYGLVTDAVNKMAAGEHAEVQYPWHHPDGHIMIVRCGGILNPSYTSGIRIEGTHQDVSKMLHFDESVLRKEQKDLSLSLISSLSETYSTLYYVNPDTGSYQLITTDQVFGDKVNARLSHGGDFYEDLMLSVGNVIYEEDRDIIMGLSTKAGIESALASNPSFKIDYRLLIDGAPVWYSVKVVKIQDESGESHYAIGVRNIEAEKRMEEEARNKEIILRRNFDIIEILASEYSSVYYIDLTTDGLNPYTMNEETETSFGSVFRSGITYSEAFRMYVDRLVLSEDKAMMLQAGSIGNIMKELRTKKTFLTTYRNSEGHYSEMKFVKVGNEDGVPEAVALGFADKDAEIRARREEEQKLQRNIDIIEILASEYSSVYYIDLTTDELDPYTMNEETETEFGKIFRSGIHYSDAFKMYVNTLVWADDKLMMLRAGSIYNILKELGTKKTFLTTYRNSEGHYCEMKFVKVGDDENPHSVALGFADKDEEIRNEKERQKTAERDMAVISGLSDDFGCVVYTSFDTLSEYHYRFDPLFEKHIPGWSSINDFGMRLRRLAETLIHPDDRGAFLAATRPDVVRKAVDQDNVYYVNFRLLAEGEVTYYQLKFVKDEHSDNHVIAGFHNVDAETKRELEALKKAENASKAKTDFLFNMSHDIRTPMNAVIGFTDMALREVQDNDKAKECLSKVKHASNMLLSLINDILDMSRIESGKVQMHEENVDLSNAFDSLKAVMNDQANAKGIELSFNNRNLRDKNVVIDHPRVERILVNLLSNAIKYTPRGGYVHAMMEQLEYDEPGVGLYRFEVSDNGIGMSEEFQKHMFEEFSREETSTVSGIQGTGLGLSLAQKLVDLMGGTISCTSKQGEGSTFQVTIPFKLPMGTSVRSSTQRQEDGDATILVGRRALLVEDNELNREITTAILEMNGLTIESSTNGEEAVTAVLDKGPAYYDFILMDIQMPIMDGYKATKRIRELVPDLKTPIIALSANAFEEDKQKSREAGMDDHIAKPIDVSELVSTLKKYLS